MSTAEDRIREAKRILLTFTRKEPYITNAIHRIWMLKEKSPERLSSDSLRLSNSSIAQITDTLKDYALKVVANAHSEMSEEQWTEYLEEITITYAKAIEDRLRKEAK